MFVWNMCICSTPVLSLFPYPIPEVVLFPLFVVPGLDLLELVIMEEVVLEFVLADALCVGVCAVRLVGDCPILA